MIFCECRNTMFFNCLFVTFFTSLGQNHIRRMTHMRRSAVFSAALRTGGGRVGGRAVRKHSRRHHIVSAFATLPTLPTLPRRPRRPTVHAARAARTVPLSTLAPQPTLTRCLLWKRSVYGRHVYGRRAILCQTSRRIGNRMPCRESRSV